MRKFTKALLMFAIIGGLNLASCSDDDVKKDDNYPGLEENMIDLTDGLNVMIIEIGDDTSFHIPLKTKEEVEWNVTAENDEEIPFSLRLETGADKLITLICDGIDSEKLSHPGPHLYKVHLAVKKRMISKDIQVVVRSNAPTGATLYAEKYIGHAMNPNEGYQSVKQQPVLDLKAIILQGAYNIMEGESVERVVKFETGGKRYDETMQTLAEQTGISGDALFVGSLGSTPFSHTPYQCDDVINYENYLGYRGLTLAQVKIDQDILEDAIDNGSFTKYLDITVNDLFNNSNSKEYQKYPNDYDGVKALLDRMGAFVIVNAGFGGTYQFKYARKENTYYDHIGIDATTYLTRSIYNSGSVDSWLNAYSKDIGNGDNQGYIDSQKPQQTNYGVSYRGIDKSFSKISVSGVASQNVSHDATINTTHNGINIKDTLYNIANWEKLLREDRNNWTLTNYRLMNQKNEFEGMELIPIYKFISEPRRKAAVEKYFNDYLQACKKQRETHHLVVADFFMEVCWNSTQGKGGQSHSHSPAKYGGSQSPVTKDMLPRTVLVSNMNAPCRHNLAMETNCDDYIVCTTSDYHYWYYVLGYHEDGEGFTDIRFSNKNLTGGWVRRGNHADKGTDGVLLDDNYVWIKTDSKAKYDDKVKAVALSKDKAIDEYYGDKIMASSAPGEMDKIKPSDHETFKQTEFYRYWNTVNAKPYDETHFYEGGAVFYNRFKVVANWDPTGIEETGLCRGEKNLGHPNTEPLRNMAPYGE